MENKDNFIEWTLGVSIRW